MPFADLYESIKNWFPPRDLPGVVHSRQDRYLHSLARMHERLFHSRDLTRIDFSDHLRYLISGVLDPIISEREGVRIGIESHGVFMDIDTAILCGALIHELLFQALPRAEAEPGEIRVELGLNDDARYRLILRGEGNGLSRLVHSEESAAGMNLIEMLVDQLCGKMEIRGGESTAVYIVFTGPRS